MRLTLERLCYGLWITRKNGMVQNQVTIVWFCHRWVQRAFRQAMQLAEGQKIADVKHNSPRHPPPPANYNWRSGSNFPRNMQVSDLLAIIWRKGSNFPRKMRISGSLRPSLAEGAYLDC